MDEPKRTFVTIQKNSKDESDSGISSPFNVRHCKPKFQGKEIDLGEAPPIIQSIIGGNKLNGSTYATKSDNHQVYSQRLDVHNIKTSSSSGFHAYISSSEERDESLTNSKRHFTVKNKKKLKKKNIFVYTKKIKI